MPRQSWILGNFFNIQLSVVSTARKKEVADIYSDIKSIRRLSHNTRRDIDDCYTPWLHFSTSSVTFYVGKELCLLLEILQALEFSETILDT